MKITSHTLNVIKKNYLQILRTRTFLIDEEIQKIGSQMLGSQSILQWKIASQSDLVSPEVHKADNRYIITIPPLFLIHANDVHHDEIFIKNIYDFLKKENPLVLTLFLEFHSDQEMSKKGRTFALSHEIAHIALVPHHESFDPLDCVKVPGVQRSGKGLYAVNTTLSPIVEPRALSRSPEGQNFRGGVLGHLDENAPKNREEAQVNEKMADLHAARTIPGASEGGVYLFEIMSAHYPHAVNGNHPSPSDRMNYLRDSNVRT